MVAADDPETVPNISQETIVVIANPPRTHPTIDNTQSTSRWDNPPSPMTAAPKMKKGMAIRANLSMLPNICVAMSMTGVSVWAKMTMAAVATIRTNIGMLRSSRITPRTQRVVNMIKLMPPMGECDIGLGERDVPPLPHGGFDVAEDHQERLPPGRRRR